jgi:hypothetical protein
MANDRTVVAHQSGISSIEPARLPIFKRAYFLPTATSEWLSTNRYLEEK